MGPFVVRCLAGTQRNTRAEIRAATARVHAYPRRRAHAQHDAVAQKTTTRTGS